MIDPVSSPPRNPSRKELLHGEDNVKTRFISIALFTLLVGGPALAADHIDSPATTAEPAADLTDFYAWMSNEASMLNMAIGTHPFATGESRFSDAAMYAFHVGSTTGYGEAEQTTDVICRFYRSGAMIECWAGDEYVTGDPSNPAGISSDSGKLRVFAGLRNDPFYFELTGFQNAVKTVVSAAPSLSFDDNMCPVLDADTAGSIVGLLQSGNDGAPASNTLAGANVMALVVQVDKSVVNSGGPLLAAWASSHRAQL